MHVNEHIMILFWKRWYGDLLPFDPDTFMPFVLKEYVFNLADALFLVSATFLLSKS